MFEQVLQTSEGVDVTSLKTKNPGLHQRHPVESHLMQFELQGKHIPALRQKTGPHYVQVVESEHLKQSFIAVAHGEQVDVPVFKYVPI